MVVRMAALALRVRRGVECRDVTVGSHRPLCKFRSPARGVGKLDSVSCFDEYWDGSTGHEPKVLCNQSALRRQAVGFCDNPPPGPIRHLRACAGVRMQCDGNGQKTAPSGPDRGYTFVMIGNQLIRCAGCLVLLALACALPGADGLAVADATGPLDLASALTKPITETRPVRPIPGQTTSRDDSMDLGATPLNPGLPTAPLTLAPDSGRLSAQADWLRIYGRQRHLPAPPPTSFFQLVAPNFLQKPNYVFHLSSDWHSWATLGAGFTQLF